MTLKKLTDEQMQAKRDREKATVTQMIEIYCRGNHKEARAQAEAAGTLEIVPGTKKGLCPECAELAHYTQATTQRCPRMETKTFCSSCDIHCYTPEERERIREVMRYSAPRMLYHNPVGAIRHAIDTARAARAARALEGQAADGS